MVGVFFIVSVGCKEYFKNESEACEYFIDEMRDDPTTKADWKSGFSM